MNVYPGCEGAAADLLRAASRATSSTAGGESALRAGRLPHHAGAAPTGTETEGGGAEARTAPEGGDAETGTAETPTAGE